MTIETWDDADKRYQEHKEENFVQCDIHKGMVDPIRMYNSNICKECAKTLNLSSHGQDEKLLSQSN